MLAVIDHSPVLQRKFFCSKKQCWNSYSPTYKSLPSTLHTWCACASSEAAWELFSSHWNTTAHSEQTEKCLKKAVPSHLPSCQGLAQQHMSIVQVCLHQLPPFLTLMSHILERGNGKKPQKINTHEGGKARNGRERREKDNFQSLEKHPSLTLL